MNSKLTDAITNRVSISKITLFHRDQSGKNTSLADSILEISEPFVEFL